ncbi:Proline and serine-rich protein 3 [Liparis tanakae]|uniref:Proline and serine-rich protein 3 n=1 Tax=Liparis tanakae TaxID=230148 RepID=A0A4Z2HRR5_9TELE|nr:Proline and serine-rich protein 3 [Liparis tanakae]
MKSRGAKGYYQPSCSKSISKKKNKTTSSPVNSNPRSSSQSHTLCPETQQRVAATDEQPVFAESWPSTECGSCSSRTTTSSDMETPKPQYARAGQSTDSLDVGVQQDSVLAKYIDRFRHGRPQSREERQQSPLTDGEKQHPFWWMSPSSLPCSSTPTKTIDQDGIQPLKDDFGLAIFSPAGQHQPKASTESCVIPPLVPPARREEDILFQWRLRRKIEQAREGSQSLQHSSRQATERAELIHHKRSEGNKKEKAQTRKSGKNETKTATSFRKQKKSMRCTVEGEHVDGPGTRSSSHPKVPKIVQPCAEQQQQEGSQEFSNSDEKEFEDDSLLLVLRKQRKWVKEQIREVDSKLIEFLEEQHVT